MVKDKPETDVTLIESNLEKKMHAIWRREGGGKKVERTLNAATETKKNGRNVKQCLE